MKRILLALALIGVWWSSAHAQAPLRVDLIHEYKHPTKIDGKLIPLTGPGSIGQVTSEYGTCRRNGRFGIWQGAKTKDYPVESMIFPDLSNIRRCSRAKWFSRSGKLLFTSSVVKNEALQ
jgi:hypothetical protein